MTSGHNNSHNPAKTRTPILISARSMKMPKMPEVTMHVTTESDPKEAREYKASADAWAEQCRTLQRTLLDTQLERDRYREALGKVMEWAQRQDYTDSYCLSECGEIANIAIQS